MPYTVVGKLETLTQDLHYIGRMAGVNFNVNYAARPSSAKSGSGVNSSSVTSDWAKKYFSELDKNMVRQLYKIYKVDFEMFGYSPTSLDIVI